MDLHLVKTADGYAIVTRRPGPYSFSAEIEDVVLALTPADLDRFSEDMRGIAPHVVVPTVVPPVESAVVPPAVVPPVEEKQ